MGDAIDFDVGHGHQVSSQVSPRKAGDAGNQCPWHARRSFLVSSQLWWWEKQLRQNSCTQ
jgi:hypothetical protein